MKYLLPKMLLAAVLLVPLFRYLAEFSFRQSITLTVLAGLAWALSVYGSTSRYGKVAFRPFLVRVQPHWLDILRDQHLMSDEKEWKALEADIEDLPPSEYNVVRSGIMFTVLKPDERSFWPALIYWDHDRRFTTKVDVYESISAKRWSALGPQVYLKRGIHGYELGIAVFSFEPGGLEPRKDLMIATLPYEEFCVYWYKPGFLPDHWEKFKRHRDQLLADNGWKRIPSQLEHLPDYLEHKYFKVYHEAI